VIFLQQHDRVRRHLRPPILSSPKSANTQVAQRQTAQNCLSSRRSRSRRLNVGVDPMPTRPRWWSRGRLMRILDYGCRPWTTQPRARVTPGCLRAVTIRLGRAAAATADQLARSFARTSVSECGSPRCRAIDLRFECMNRRTPRTTYQPFLGPEPLPRPVRPSVDRGSSEMVAYLASCEATSRFRTNHYRRLRAVSA
jgi:hypothetical protein